MARKFASQDLTLTTKELITCSDLNSGSNLRTGEHKNLDEVAIDEVSTISESIREEIIVLQPECLSKSEPDTPGFCQRKHRIEKSDKGDSLIPFASSLPDTTQISL